MADYTINVNAVVNQPPSSVGDGSSTIDYGETLVFTVAMLTTDTTPAYADPEGDDPENLIVDTLPSSGELQYNSTAVTIGQIISFSDIALGLLTFVPDNGTTTSYVPSFQFGISDVGSSIFTR